MKSFKNFIAEIKMGTEGRYGPSAPLSKSKKKHFNSKGESLEPQNPTTAFTISKRANGKHYVNHIMGARGGAHDTHEKAHAKGMELERKYREGKKS